MTYKILFVHPPSPTYSQMADEIADRNHSSFGLADGDEASPTVSNTLQRGERKYSVYGEMSLPLGISYLSSFLKKNFPDNLEQYLVDYVDEQHLGIKSY